MKKFFADLRGKKNEGFTLVELMVVVAIIGILSAVAIPNFKQYQAKTKTSEAKLQLSAVYSSLISLQSDYDAFATCLEDAGYSPSLSGNYYAIGFASDNTQARGIVSSNGGICGSATNLTNTGTPAITFQYQFHAHKKVGGQSATGGNLGSIAFGSVTNKAYYGDITTASLSAPSVDNTGTYFVAGAIGYVDSKFITPAKASKWIINENKALIQINKGY